MKPWLFDILACPIDKSYPLKLYIFSFETKAEEFEEIIEIYNKKDLETIKKEKIIEISEKNGEKFLKDNIIMEKNQINTYLELIIKSITELDNFIDKTNLDIIQKCYDILKSSIKPKIIEFSKIVNERQIDELLPELYFINRFKLEVEIETGLLYCENCHRWYPIVDTIPQMLPDKYRDAKKDIEFLKNNKNLLDEEFFNQDLKPFNIK